MSKAYQPSNQRLETHSLRVKGSGQKNKIIKPQLIQNTSNTQGSKHDRHVSFDKVNAQRDQRSFDHQVAYSNIPIDPIQGSKPTQVPTLANEYRERQRRMDERLIKEIESNSIAPAQNQRRNSQEHEQAPTQLQNQHADNPTAFYRSQRSVAMRIKDNYENELQILETDKLQLIQRLNDALLQLDKINQEKTEMSNQLIEQIKFVRDLQRETQKGDDLNGVVNEGLRLDLKREKELNFKIKEDLKRIDLEKMRTLQRLRDLQGNSQDYKLEAADMNIALRTKYVHMQALEDDYREVIRKLEVAHQEVDTLRSITIDNQISLDLLRESIKQENFNREASIEKLRQIQDRLDDALERHLREKHEIHLVQDRQVHLLSSKALFMSLSECLERRKKFAFQTIFRDSYTYYAYRKGIKKSREIVKRKTVQRVKKGFFTWYQKGLKPSKNIKQKENITEVLSKNNPKALVFGRWVAYLHQSQQDKVIQHQMISQLLKTKNSYNSRMLMYGFNRWRDSIIRTDKGHSYRQKLMKKILNHKLNYLGQAFLRWQHFSIEVDFHIRMNGMARQLTKKKYVQVLYYQWREVTKFKKMRRINRMIRTWKNLKANMHKQKQVKSTMATLFREEVMRKKNQMQICFDAIRSQRRYDKLVSMTKDLTYNVRPSIEKSQFVIAHANDNRKDRSKINAGTIVNLCFGRKLQSYFQKWKTTGEHKDEILYTSVKRQVIIAYQNKLRDAFTAWIAFKGRAMLHTQMEQINFEDDQHTQMTIELTQERNVVNEKRKRQMCQSGKSVKKIAISAFQRLLKSKFDQWRKNMQILDTKGDGLAKMVKIFDRMKKKEVFSKYFSQVDEVKQEETFLLRVKEGRFKLDCRQKKRIYDGIREFVHNHKMAKNYLERMFFRLDKATRKIGFKKWFKYTEFKKEGKLMKKELKIVEVVNALKLEEGEYQDECHGLETHNQNLQRDLFHRTRRVINKWFLRSSDVNTKYAFSVWKEYSQKIWAQEQTMKKVLKKMCKATTLFAFRLWKERIKNKKFSLIRMDTLREEQEIATTMRLLESNFSKFQRAQESNEFKLKKQKEQQGIFYAKQQNCLDALIDRKNLYYCLPKEQYILKKWHEYTMNRKHAFHYFGKILTKATYFEGFNDIKKFFVERKFAAKKQDMALRILKKSQKLKQKLALRKWKDSIYHTVIMQSFQLMDYDQKLNIDKRKQKKAVNKKKIFEVESHARYLTLYNAVHKFKAYIQKKKLLKEKIKTQRDNLRYGRRKSALQLWHGRMETTRKVYRAAEKVNQIYKGLNSSKVFLEWKAYSMRLKNFLRKFATFESKVDRIYKMICMSKIKGRAMIIQEKREKKIAKARKNGKKFLHYMIYERLRQEFRKFKDKIFMLRREDATKKRMIQNWLVHDKRAYFKQWKLNAQKIEVVKFNQEEGPVKVETSKLRAQYFALKQKLVEDGHTPDEIEHMVAQSRQRDLGLLKKGLARIQCYNDELRMLPFLFDQWKAWVIERKRFKYWTNFLNKRANYKTSYLQIAFDQWKNMKDNRKVVLQQQTKEKLTKLANKNFTFLNQRMDEEDEKELVINDLSSQRDILLKAFVGSQKLALSASHASYERCGLKAFTRLQENYDNQRQNELLVKLKENLASLQQLKDGIQKMEKSNVYIAEQNDALKAGALEGIEMAKNFESLSNDREKLSMDIADKAITIRKLLEDNQNLSIRLNHAQEEAFKLIKASQMSFTSSGANYGLA